MTITAENDARNRDHRLGPDRPIITPPLSKALSPLGVFEQDGRLYARIESETSEAIYEVHPPCEGRSGHDDVWLFSAEGSIARSRLQTYDYEFSNGGTIYRAAVRKAWDLAEAITGLHRCQAVARERGAANLTQAQLAERLGCSQQAIDRIERGAGSPPSLDRLLEIAKALGCKPSKLDKHLSDKRPA